MPLSISMSDRHSPIWTTCSCGSRQTAPDAVLETTTPSLSRYDATGSTMSARAAVGVMTRSATTENATFLNASYTLLESLHVSTGLLPKTPSTRTG